MQSLDFYLVVARCQNCDIVLSAHAFTVTAEKAAQTLSGIDVVREGSKLWSDEHIAPVLQIGYFTFTDGKPVNWTSVKSIYPNHEVQHHSNDA